MKTLTKYTITDRCTCKGYAARGECKHMKMLRGVWTYPEGTNTWFESEFDGIFEVKLPEEFNTAVVRHPLPYDYQFLALTVRYQQYRMGVLVVDPCFDRSKFLNVTSEISWD